MSTSLTFWGVIMRKMALLTIVVILAALLTGCTEVGETDETPPEISQISAVDISQTSAFITWTTDEPATSQVKYGLSTNYTSTVSNENLVTSHRVYLDGLTANNTYHYNVKSKDASGNAAISGDNTFTTATTGDTTPPVISELSVSDITTSTATITWTTDEPATSQVEYGLTESYGSTISDDELVTIRSIQLTGLIISSTYHYRVKSEDASGNEKVSGDNTFTAQGAPSEQWAAYAFDQEVSPKTGSSGTIESFTITETYNEEGVIREFEIAGTYEGTENTEIKTTKWEMDLAPPYDSTETTVSTWMDCYKVKHRVTVLRDDSGEEHPDWAEVTVWIPTDEFATAALYFWIYPKAEYLDSDGHTGKWSYYLTEAMQNEMQNPPSGKQIVYLPYLEGEFYGYDASAFHGLYGWAWFWFASFAEEGDLYFEEGSWSWGFEGVSSTYSVTPVTESIGSYTFDAWSVNIAWSYGGDAGEYSGIFSPDLPIPIYLKLGATSGSGQTYFEYELTDLTLG